MNDLDLDRLGDLWRAEPDPQEMQRLQRSATAAARRARWGQLSDYLLTALVSAGILLLVWSDPSLKTGLVGSVAILLMLVSTIYQRRLRLTELKAVTGTSEQMLDQSIERLHATHKRSAYGLLLAIPAILLGLGFGAALEDSDGRLLERLRAYESTVPYLSTLIVAGFAFAVVYLIVSARRSRAELARLKALREAYRRESEAAQ